MKRILLLGDLPDPAWCAPFGLLADLRDQGVIEWAPCRAEHQIPVAGFNADAILCRPSKGGHLKAEFFDDKPRRPLVIGTLSKDRSHIVLPDGYVKEIVAATGDENAPAVADLAVYLGTELLRPVGEASSIMARWGWDTGIDVLAHQLDGLSWGCLGTGAQVRYLLPQLIAKRCREVVVFHPAMNTARFLAATRGFATNWSPTENGALHMSVRNPAGEETIVRGTSDFNLFLQSSDIVSLHVPPESREDIEQRKRAGKPVEYEFVTVGIICRQNIERMKNGVRIVNVSRGSLINEPDVLAGLRTEKIAGFAADVVYPDAENQHNPDASPLWQEFGLLEHSRSPGKLRNRRLLLTPHIGGATVQAVTAVAQSVLPRFLKALGVEPALKVTNATR